MGPELYNLVLLALSTVGWGTLAVPFFLGRWREQGPWEVYGQHRRHPTSPPSSPDQEHFCSLVHSSLSSQSRPWWFLWKQGFEGDHGRQAFSSFPSGLVTSRSYVSIPSPAKQQIYRTLVYQGTEFSFFLVPELCTTALQVDAHIVVL